MEITNNIKKCEICGIEATNLCFKCISYYCEYLRYNIWCTQIHYFNSFSYNLCFKVISASSNPFLKPISF